MGRKAQRKQKCQSKEDTDEDESSNPMQPRKGSGSSADSSSKDASSSQEESFAPKPRLSRKAARKQAKKREANEEELGSAGEEERCNPKSPSKRDNANSASQDAYLSQAQSTPSNTRLSRKAARKQAKREVREALAMTKAGKTSKAVGAKRSTVSRSDVCGLQNLGNTCFMNSVLQVLNQTLPFVELFHFDQRFAVGDGHDDGLLSSVLITIAKLWTTEGPFSPKHILKAIVSQAPQFRGRNQQDAQEFLIILLDGLRTEFAVQFPKQLNPMEDMFSWCLRSTITCHDCKQMSTCLESTFDLPVAIPSSTPKASPASSSSARKPNKEKGKRSHPRGADEGPPPVDHLSTDCCEPEPVAKCEGGEGGCLEACLRIFFQPERMEGENGYQCDTCRTAHRQAIAAPEQAPCDPTDVRKAACHPPDELPGQGGPPSTPVADLKADEEGCSFAACTAAPGGLQGEEIGQEVTAEEAKDLAGPDEVPAPEVKETTSTFSSHSEVARPEELQREEAPDAAPPGSPVHRTPMGAICTNPPPSPTIRAQSHPSTTCTRKSIGKEKSRATVLCKPHPPPTPLQLSTATKQVLIERLPQVLIIHLKRFTCSERGLWVKNDATVSFPLSLCLAPFCSPPPSAPADASSDPKFEAKYRLYGLVEHLGGMKGGHYVAYARRLDSKTRQRTDWVHCSDSHVCEATEQQVLEAQAYLLFYEREPPLHNSHCCE
eukprot:GGOE01021787.1.p1 GENE.GGOE01021787.1~~GGOE01021787.1.p1  ORF type:complete len:717 (-),score=129.25 GGOE01021787.1:55-2205(-)